MDILVTEDLQSPAIERLAHKHVLARDGVLWKEPGRLKTTIADTKVLLVRNQTPVTSELLHSAPKLLCIGRIGVGLDNIDVEAASALGMVVIAPLNANAASVAELTLGLILAMARKIPQGDRTTKAGHWDRKGCTGTELAGKTLAICGLGRIGRIVAKLARAFGMRVVAFDAYVKADSPAVRETDAQLCGSLEEALASADFVSVHLPLTSATHHLFSGKMFATMKPGAYFVNTSRGAVVDETALVASLQSGHIAGAALDVREVEPPGSKAGLESMPNVILTPHIGAFTTQAQQRTFEAVSEDVERILGGQPAIHFINFDRPRR